MEHHGWRVSRTRGDIIRIVPISILLSYGLLQLLVFSIRLTDWMRGLAPFPSSEGELQVLLAGAVMTLTGLGGLALFIIARKPRADLLSLRASLISRYGASLPSLVPLAVVDWYARRPSPARTFDFRRDAWPFAFAVVAAGICLFLAFVGLLFFTEDVAWFFPASAFILSMPIALYWVAHGAGHRRTDPAPILHGLAAGALAAIPAVLLEVYFSRSVYFLAHAFGGVDAALLDIIEGAVGAPLIEEGVKVGAVLVLIFAGKVQSRRSGFAAGLSVGLGFAFFENALYYTGDSSPILLLRPVNMALHMLGPAIVGAALGGFRWGEGKASLAAGGFLLGIVVHAGWNGILAALPYLYALSIRLSGTEQAVLLTLLAHLFVTPLLICGALYVAGKRLAS